MMHSTFVHLRRAGVAALGMALLLAASQVKAQTADFEGFPTGTALSNEYPGVVFSNAVILNVPDYNFVGFPPHSGIGVVYDAGSPIIATFTGAVFSVSGYVTYLAPLTLTAFDSGNNVVATAFSATSNNANGNGIPNELIGVSFAGGISRVEFATINGGNSFTLDDLSYGEVSAVPEPGSVATGLIMFSGVAAGLVRARRKKS